MMLSGTERCHLLVAFGADGEDEQGEPTYAIESTALYLLESDEALVRELESGAVRFWSDFVERRVPPPGKPMHCVREWKKLLKGQQPTEAEATHG